MLEASRAHERLGQLTQSAACAQGAVEAFSAQGNDLFAAQAQGKIADILQARGKLDEALAMWRDEALPVFERIGYAVEAKIARERMAALEVLLLRPAKGKR